jgi:hypothetical protein
MNATENDSPHLNDSLAADLGGQRNDAMDALGKSGTLPYRKLCKSWISPHLSMMGTA